MLLLKHYMGEEKFNEKAALNILRNYMLGPFFLTDLLLYFLLSEFYDVWLLILCATLYV